MRIESDAFCTHFTWSSHFNWRRPCIRMSLFHIFGSLASNQSIFEWHQNAGQKKGAKKLEIIQMQKLVFLLTKLSKKAQLLQPCWVGFGTFTFGEESTIFPSRTRKRRLVLFPDHRPPRWSALYGYLQHIRWNRFPFLSSDCHLVPSIIPFLSEPWGKSC